VSAWRCRTIAPPARILRALAALFGEAAALLGSVRVIEHSRLVRLHGPARATTRHRRIYLRGSAAQFFADPELVLHEYCHVLMQWETGELTRLRYLVELVRRGYWNNRFEIAAREFARVNLLRFRSELKRQGVA